MDYFPTRLCLVDYFAYAYVCQAVRASEEKLEEMNQTLEETQKILVQKKAVAVDRGRASTPRPDWEEAKASLNSHKTMGEEELDIAKTTCDITQQLEGTVLTHVARSHSGDGTVYFDPRCHLPPSPCPVPAYPPTATINPTPSHDCVQFQVLRHSLSTQ